MLEITPKIFAPTFFSFIGRRTKIGSIMPLKTFIQLFLGLSVAGFITISLGKHELASASIEERFVAATIYITLMFSAIFAIIGGSSFFLVWPNRWIYMDNKIEVIKKYSTSTLFYNHLERITLDTPYSASLLFNDHNSVTVRSTSWYGTSKEDWLSFIKLLDRNGATPDVKVWVTYNDGFNIPQKR